MGNTFKLGNYVNGIFQDASNNIGIGAAPSGTYKLEVTGTAKVSSTLLLGGALSGTSATFSSDLSVINTSNALLKVYSNTTSSPIADIELMRGTNTTWGADAYTDYRIRSSGGDLLIQSGESTVTSTRLTIASTGAATFSGQVGIGVAPSESLTIYGAVIRLQGAAGVSPFAIANNNSSGFRIYDYNAGVDRMTITSGGNVLIGKTTNAGGRLQVSNGTITFNVDHNADGAYLTAATDNNVSYRRLSYDATEHLFFTSAAEKMRITSGGYFKASNDAAYLNVTGTYHEFTNNTSATATTVIRNTAGNFTDNILAIGSSKGTNSNFNHIAAYTSDFSNIVFKVRGDGNVYNVNGVYTSGVSDIKYKEQIIDANSQWEDIKNLRVVNFKFIKDVKENGEDALKHIGFIAQEVEKVSPNLIEEMTDNKTGETWKTIKTSIIHTKAIKALQEAMLKIEALQDRLDKAGL